MKNPQIIALVIGIFMASVSHAKPSIESVKAKLFDFNKGTFGEDIIESHEYGNVVMSSNGLLVIVEAKIERGGQTLNIVLSEEGKKKRVVGKASFKNTFGKTLFPIFTNDFGCSPIKIQVSFSEGGKSQDLKTETIPFTCYE